MSQNYSPKIITDDLKFYLDAANTKSYSGSGTDFNDLSRGRNNCILVGGVTFNTQNSGNLVFDGTDDYCDFFVPDLSSVATIEMWCKIGASYSNNMFFGWNDYDVWCGSGNLGFNTANSDVYGISSTTVTNLGLVNNWKHYCFVMRTDVSYSNNKIYVNGVSQSLSQIQGSENVGFRSFNSGSGRIAGWKRDTSYRMPMNFGSFKVYNRELTQSEILKNYETTKTRFGL